MLHFLEFNDKLKQTEKEVIIKNEKICKSTSRICNVNVDAGDG